jgi:hypothetical protein
MYLPWDSRQVFFRDAIRMRVTIPGCRILYPGSGFSDHYQKYSCQASSLIRDDSNPDLPSRKGVQVLPKKCSFPGINQVKNFKNAFTTG